jgi:SPP1 family predicted phage head-tail adaptor
MNIAFLSEQILLQKVSITSDEIGNRISSWQDYFACCATVSAVSPKEEAVAGVIWDESAIDFTVRWCTEIDPLNSKEYRVIFRDQIYSIEGIDHMNYKKKAVKFHCRRVEA